MALSAANGSINEADAAGKPNAARPCVTFEELAVGQTVDTDNSIGYQVGWHELFQVRIGEFLANSSYRGFSFHLGAEPANVVLATHYARKDTTN